MNDYEAKLEARRERLLALADRMQGASDAAYRQARRMGDAIPFGQPILVGHYSEKRDRNYRARIWRTQDRCLELKRKADYFRGLAEGVGKGGVSSDDPDAIDKLQEKVAKLEADQSRMKLANAAIRREKKNGPVEQLAALVRLGYPEAIAGKLLQPDFCGRIGFPNYMLTNNNANIRRIKARIEELGRRPTEDVEREVEGGIRYREDVGENRVMLFFPGKPDEHVRRTLKGYGFKWSPTRGAWVRFLNGGGRYAAEAALRGISVKVA